MFKITKINRKTGQANVVRKEGKKLRFDDMKQADAFAARCAFSESNPNVIYMVLMV